MTDATRAELLSRIERGEIAVRDLAGLTEGDIRAIEHVGRVAFEGGRYDKAAKIFGGLAALEPDRPEHVLRRAFALSAAGKRELAVEIVTGYLELEAQFPPEDLVRALLLRAQLVTETDAEGARADVVLARVIAESSPAAKLALEALGR
jgi:hypothetical protein